VVQNSPSNITDVKLWTSTHFETCFHF